MKLSIDLLTAWFLAMVVLIHTTNAQQEPQTKRVVPVAFDKYFFLGDPKNAKQMFIGEICETDGRIVLAKIVYLPKSDGMRGTKVDFVDVKSLGRTTVWKAVLQVPVNESTQCHSASYFGKMLRYRLISIPADAHFEGLDKMPCFLMTAFEAVDWKPKDSL